MHAQQRSRDVSFAALAVYLIFCAVYTSPACAQNRSGYGDARQGGYGNQGQHQSNYRPNHDHGNYGGHGNYGRNGYRFPLNSPNFNYGYYQRPYPYHLDYYRMRYQGSYEPYAGNLYGPPLIQQNVIPPYVAPQVVAPQYLPTPYYPAPIRNYAGAYYW